MVFGDGTKQPDFKPIDCGNYGSIFSINISNNRRIQLLVAEEGNKTYIRHFENGWNLWKRIDNLN